MGSGGRLRTNHELIWGGRFGELQLRILVFNGARSSNATDPDTFVSPTAQDQLLIVGIGAGLTPILQHSGTVMVRFGFKVVQRHYPIMSV